MPVIHAHTHTPPLSCDNEKCLQALSNDPWQVWIRSHREQGGLQNCPWLRTADVEKMFGRKATVVPRGEILVAGPGLVEMEMRLNGRAT